MSRLALPRERGGRRDPHERVRERLISWGRWVEMQGRMGYGSSSLTIDPSDRGMPPAYVPVQELECSQTDDAVRKQSRQLQDVAKLEYVWALTMQDSASRMRMSERQFRRLREMLHSGVQYCIENPREPSASAAAVFRRPKRGV